MNRTIFFVAAILTPVAAQAEFKLPDTGQSQCYNNTQEIPCAGLADGDAFHGQDGHTYGPQPAYQDNGDGTVTDLSTGLVWQKTGDGYTGTWNIAINYCDDLTLGGQSDWRLPEYWELLSLVDYGKLTSPTINTDYFSSTSGGYWTSTIYSSSPTYRWQVYFQTGSTSYTHYTNSARTRCVRGGN